MKILKLFMLIFNCVVMVQHSHAYIEKKGDVFIKTNDAGDILRTYPYDTMNTLIIKKDKSALYKVSKNGKYGAIDIKGKVVVPLTMAEDELNGIELERQHVILFKDESGYFVVDEKFKPILKGRYTNIEGSYDSNHLIVTRAHNKQKKQGVFTLDGKRILDIKYDDISERKGFFIVSLKGKKGIFTEQSQILPIAYDDAYIDNDSGLLFTINNHGNDSFKEGISSFIVFNAKGKQILPEVYGNIIKQKGTDFLITITGNGYEIGYKNIGLYDFEGNEILEPKYDSISDFRWNDDANRYGNLAQIFINDKVGFINKLGQIVIPPKYDLAISYSDGYSVVDLEIREKMGVIDDNGKVVIPLKYNRIKSFIKKDELNYERYIVFKDGLAQAIKGNEVHFYNKEGKLVKTEKAKEN